MLIYLYELNLYTLFCRNLIYNIGVILPKLGWDRLQVYYDTADFLRGSTAKQYQSSVKRLQLPVTITKDV